MCGFARKDRERVEREIQEAEFNVLLEVFQKQAAGMTEFDSWASVLKFMRLADGDADRKNAVLVAIVQARSDFPDPRWATIFLAIFWPGLEGIHRRKKHWDDDRKECWQNVLLAFLAVIERLDLTKRAERLVQRIIWETIHRLHDHYRRVWRQNDFGTPTDNVLLQDKVLDWDIGCDLVDHFDEIERVIMRLRQHVKSGRINETDFFLIVSVRFKGRSIQECADELGIGYQAAKKRRQRAEASLRDLWRE